MRMFSKLHKSVRVVGWILQWQRNFLPPRALMPLIAIIARASQPDKGKGAAKGNYVDRTRCERGEKRDEFGRRTGETKDTVIRDRQSLVMIYLHCVDNGLLNPDKMDVQY